MPVSKVVNSIPIKYKLTFSFLFIVIVPIIFVGYFLTEKLYSLSLSNVYRFSNSTLMQIRDNYRQKFNSYNDILANVINYTPLTKYINTRYESDYKAIQDYLDKVAPIMVRLRHSSGDVLIRVYTNNETVGFSGETSTMLRDAMRQSWFDGSDLSGNKLKWVVAGDITGIPSRQYLGCYRVMKEPADYHKVNAVTAVFFEETQLHSLILEEQAAGKILFLYDQNGKILTTTERELLFEDMDGLGLYRDYAGGSIQNQSIVTYKGGEYLFLAAPLEDQGLLMEKWGIIYLIPAGSVLKGINDVWISSVILCVVCLLFSAMVIMLVSSNITRRIWRLIRKIAVIRQGDFKTPVEISGTDEIGELERDFNMLVNKVDNLINEVFAANMRLKDAELDYHRIQAEKREAEIIALQGQINPHYLFNTLEAIRMNLVVNGDRKTAGIIQAFAESFRICIENRKDIFTLEEELKFISNYIAVQKYRLGDRVSFTINVPNDIRSRSIPKLLVQPLVENAICHGIGRKDSGGVVGITAWEEAGAVHVRVTDDGVGMDAGELEALRGSIYRKGADRRAAHAGQMGIALANIHSRIRLMYGDEYGLTVTSASGIGTQAEIRFPSDIPAEEDGGDV